MYIYKITVIPLNQCYIGFDTKPVYKQARWKDHCRAAFKGSKNRKIHNAMRAYSIENCQYEVIASGFETLGQLALAEIDFIKQHDSYRNGLNSTPGGDGLGRNGLALLATDEIDVIRSALGATFTEYNKQKWDNTSLDERRKMLAHLFTDEVNEKKSATLKEYYNSTPGAKESKGVAIIEWQKNNRVTLLENNRKNSLLGSAKVSKKLLVEFPDGSMLHYSSKSEFLRQTGLWAKTILDKTAKGLSHNGYKAWEQ